MQPVDQESSIAHTIMCYLDDINTDKQLRDFQQRIFGQDIMILINQVPKALPLNPRHETPCERMHSPVPIDAGLMTET